MEEQKIIVYVKVDSAGCIVEINSFVFITDFVDWIQIDEGTGDKYAHAQSQYLEKGLSDSTGYNYKLVNNKAVLRTAEEKQADSAYIERVRTTKLQEIAAACEQTIYAGTDVTTTKGTEHFSATAADQTNLSALAATIAQGATQVPYHADGQLCREFTAAEFTTVFTTVKNFIAYNTTLCNHLNVWIRRCTTAAEISAITYLSTLPEDLLVNFNLILGIKANSSASGTTSASITTADKSSSTGDSTQKTESTT